MMRVPGIPPITSTGSNRSKTLARLDGLAHMSLGRYMSIKRKEEEECESWNITKHVKSDFNKKSEKRKPAPVKYKTEQIKSIIDVFHNYNDEGDLAIILEFSGFEFLSSTFNRINNKDETLCYAIPISIKGKKTRLILKTTRDIFEYKINKTADDDLNGDDIHIPELLQDYDSLSMTAALKNNWVIVTYKKK